MSSQIPLCLYSSRILTLCILAWQVGCASRQEEHPVVCADARCIQKVVMEPHYDACIRTLFRGAIGQQSRKAIVEEFGYPFTDASGYYDWRRMGGDGPAPDEWCERYARHKVTSPYGVGMSLR
jgi:hypothetical protein